MMKIKIIFVLGLATAIMPFAGLPGVWQDRGYVVFGLVVALLSFLIRHESKNKMREENGDESSGVFVENASTTKPTGQDSSESV
jgi:hypothetical protein